MLVEQGQWLPAAIIFTYSAREPRKSQGRLSCFFGSGENQWRLQRPTRFGEMPGSGIAHPPVQTKLRSLVSAGVAGGPFLIQLFGVPPSRGAPPPFHFTGTPTSFYLRGNLLANGN